MFFCATDEKVLVCILLPRFWYLQAHIFSLRHRLLLFSCWLAHTKRNISHLLLPQSSGSQECCWLRRKFFQKAPISHWFPKKYSVFLQNYSFLSCTLTTLWPLLQIHVQHWYCTAVIYSTPHCSVRVQEHKHLISSAWISLEIWTVPTKVLSGNHSSLMLFRNSVIFCTFLQKQFITMSLGLILPL